MKDITPDDPGSPAAAAPPDDPATAGGGGSLARTGHAPGVPATPPQPAQPRPQDRKPNSLRSAVLYWSGAFAAVALLAVPISILLGNSAVLGGHPALPILLLAAVGLGILWMLILLRRSPLFHLGPLFQRSTPINRPDPNNQRTAANSRQQLPTASSWQLARGLVVRIAALGLVAGLVWLSPFRYQPSGDDGQTNGTTAEDATSITLTPEGKPSAGLIFYPGARVDAHAYQDILGPLVNAGHLVVILKVPLGIALLDTSQARGVMDRHPDITAWAVGGHSLGGVSAAGFAKSNGDVSGLLLFASFPAASLAESTGLAVLSISASNDRLTTPEKVAESKSLLPPASTYATVEGGVHAFFGDYGEQPGDGQPAITREQAQQQITAESVSFMNRLRG